MLVGTYSLQPHGMEAACFSVSEVEQTLVAGNDKLLNCNSDIRFAHNGLHAVCKIYFIHCIRYVVTQFFIEACLFRERVRYRAVERFRIAERAFIRPRGKTQIMPVIADRIALRVYYPQLGAKTGGARIRAVDQPVLQRASV